MEDKILSISYLCTLTFIHIDLIIVDPIKKVQIITI